MLFVVLLSCFALRFGAGPARARRFAHKRDLCAKRLRGLIVLSVITTRSIHELGLKIGKDVVALVTSTEDSIATL